jgi:hypothetical protein
MSLSPEILIQFEYIHCSLEVLSRNDITFDEQHYRDEIAKGLMTHLIINSVVVEVTKEAGHSTELYAVRVMVKGPMIDLTLDQSGESAASTTLQCIHDTVRQIRETKDKLGH